MSTATLQELSTPEREGAAIERTEVYVDGSSAASLDIYDERWIVEWPTAYDARSFVTEVLQQFSGFEENLQIEAAAHLGECGDSEEVDIEILDLINKLEAGVRCSFVEFPLPQDGAWAFWAVEGDRLRAGVEGNSADTEAFVTLFEETISRREFDQADVQAVKKTVSEHITETFHTVEETNGGVVLRR